MAQIKTIYFSDDVIELLKEVQNVSALVNELLREYFKKNGNIKDLNKKLQEIEERRIELNNQLDSEKKLLIKEIENKEMIEIEEKKENLQKKKREEELHKNIRKNFLYFSGRDITEEEFKEFLKRREEIGLIEFVQEIKEKEDGVNS